MARNVLIASKRPAEIRSWSDRFAEVETGLGQLPPPSPERQLDHAREIFAILAKAQKGLVSELAAGSVALNYRGAPCAEAAAIEAAERVAARGTLILVRHAMSVQLKLPASDGKQDLPAHRNALRSVATGSPPVSAPRPTHARSIPPPPGSTVRA